MKLVLATRNRHKADEIRAMLVRPHLEIITLADLSGDPPRVVEDGATFAENARKKALSLARWSRHPSLADDSGLAVDALGGKPGVLSSRFAGREGDDASNNALLLKFLEEVSYGERTARFVCCLSLAAPDGRTWEVEGVVEGMVTRALRGTRGFGYDPLFLHPPTGKTFAEMEPEEKNAVSHRAAALARLKALLPELEKELASRS